MKDRLIAELEACLSEHEGEYVRMLGIDTKAKRRVLESIIQRPGSRNGNGSSAAASGATVKNYSSRQTSSTAYSSVSSSSLSSEIIEQVRSLLQQGYKIGSEHASKRRFRTNSWKSCAIIDSNRDRDVINALEACIAEHRGEYVPPIGH